MWKAGQLPVPAVQLPTGTIIVREIETSTPAVALDARVSSSDQRKDVEVQWGRRLVYAPSRGWPVVETVGEVGSGLHRQRPRLKKLLANPRGPTIIVEHRDRWMRCGAESVEAALAAHGRRRLVVESSAGKDDRVQDRLEVRTWFCARL